MAKKIAEAFITVSKVKMDTYVIYVAELPPGSSDYPLSLARWTATGPQVLAQATMPASLMPLGMANPITGKNMEEEFARAVGENCALAAIGQQLFALLADALGAELASLCSPAGLPHRLLLDLRPAELRVLPWELARQDNRLLFIRPTAVWSRGTPESVPVTPPESPLRVLVVVGSRPDDPDVEAEAEVAAIVETLKDVEAEVDLMVKWRPIPGVIKDFFDPNKNGFLPHIFHFIGHADADTRAYLAFFDGGTDQQWYAEDIENAFNAGWVPRLVFLNACRTAATAGLDLSSVTEAFLKAGVLAVLGMRSVVSGEDARRFSREFYAALTGHGEPALGNPLDEAVALARNEVFQNLQGNKVHRWEWAAPALEVRAPPEQIIHIGHGVDPVRRQNVRNAPEFSQLSRRVDRRPCWYTWRQASQPGKRVVALVGKAGIGKSEFAKMILQRCLLAGHEARLVDLKGLTTIDPLTILWLICDGHPDSSPASLLTRPLDADAFVKLKQVVQQTLGVPLNKDARLPPEKVEHAASIFEAFQNGLELIARRAPLVLVLDHLDMNAGIFKEFLGPKLVGWCAGPTDHGILLVLVLEEQQYIDFGIEAIGGVEKHTVGGFPQEAWPELAWEFVSRNLKPPAGPAQAHARKALAGFIQGAAGFVPNSWWPDKLKKLEVGARLLNYEDV